MPITRIKLKDDSENIVQTEMKLTGYTTGFTEGETTHDELDEEILESKLYIYKVKLFIKNIYFLVILTPFL